MSGRLLRASASGAWVASQAPSYLAFRRALRDPDAVQSGLLRGILARERDTAFGREHGFSRLRSVEDFRRAVPVRDYEGHRPWIERAAGGEPGVLTSDPIRLFEPSSGSASARKLIPYTARLQAAFSAGIGPWVFDMYRRRPRLLAGSAYWSISPALPEERTAGGLPVGFEDDGAYLGGLGRALVDRTLAVPARVRLHADADLFRFETLRHLLSRRDLRFVSVWNPSFLTLLLDALPGWWDALLSALPPGRARELSTKDPTRPGALWPELTLLSCWGDGAARGLLPGLRARFPGVELEPKGLIATEAFVTLPFKGRHVLALRSHFFEVQTDDGEARLPTELREGEGGALVVTTGGGLYRYRLGDRVVREGLVGRTPCLRFAGRVDKVSDLYGEKLSEAFVASVLQALGLGAFALLAPEGSGYVLFAPAASATAGLPERLEAALCENPHYAWCRRLGQLGPARVFAAEGDPQGIYLETLGQRGQRLGDIKPAALDPGQGWARRFRGRYV